MKEKCEIKIQNYIKWSW